jgi:DNA-directed RNA polymerase specialized sigma24 family protein
MDEIAFITEQTSTNVKVKLFRIRKKLYNLMNNERE